MLSAVAAPPVLIIPKIPIARGGLGRATITIERPKRVSIPTPMSGVSGLTPYRTELELSYLAK
jgi:hypothetical protein